jgi:hypothetical protein
LDIAQRIAARSLTGSWAPTKLQAYARDLERSNLPARHVEKTLELLLQTEDPDKLFAGKLIAEAKKRSLDTWIPQLPGPTHSPDGPIPWREPPPGYAPQFPLERPNAEYRRKHTEQMARMRADRERERLRPGLKEAARAALLGLAAKWAEGHAIRRCFVCNGKLKAADLTEFIEWCLEAPRGDIDARAFCNGCAWQGIHYLVHGVWPDGAEPLEVRV